MGSGHCQIMELNYLCIETKKKSVMREGTQQIPPIVQDQVEVDQNGRLKVREVSNIGVTISNVRSLVEMPDGDVYFL